MSKFIEAAVVDKLLDYCEKRMKWNQFGFSPKVSVEESKAAAFQDFHSRIKKGK